MSLAKSRRNRPSRTASTDEELPSIWSEVRAKPLRRRVVTESPPTYTPPPVELFIRWTLTFHDENPRPAMLVVSGPTAYDRLAFYRKFMAPEWDSFRPDTIEDVVGDDARNWVDETLIENLTRRISTASMPPGAKKDLPNWFPPPSHGWELLWALVGIENFVIEEPLRSMVDQTHYLVHHLYRALWEFRFALKENTTFEPAAYLFFAITRWMTMAELSADDLRVLEKIGVTRRVQSDTERFDLLFFLITLASQNGILNRMTFCFDGLESALRSDKRSLLREMDLFLGAAERWVKFTQAPVGVLIGFGASEREMSQLRKLNPKLADRIEASLAWMKPA